MAGALSFRHSLPASSRFDDFSKFAEIYTGGRRLAAVYFEVARIYNPYI